MRNHRRATTNEMILAPIAVTCTLTGVYRIDLMNSTILIKLIKLVWFIGFFHF